MLVCTLHPDKFAPCMIWVQEPNVELTLLTYTIKPKISPSLKVSGIVYPKDGPVSSPTARVTSSY